MKIVRITNNEDTSLDHLLRREGIDTVYCRPSFLSALTALHLARIADKQVADTERTATRAVGECVTIVVTENLTDTIAAVSAAKISKSQLHIIASVSSNAKTPKSIPSEIIDKVDAWVFTSQESAARYPATLKGKNIIAPIGLPLGDPLPYPSDTCKPRLLWLGEITDGKRLRAAIELLEKTQGAFTLSICGTGVAREVMPVVKWARSLPHTGNITWHGDDYDLKSELTACHAALRTTCDVTIYDTTAMQGGRQILDINEIEDFIKAPRPVKDSADTNEAIARKWARLLRRI